MMNITSALKAQMESDIAACESHTERNGSEALYSELVARYTVFDPSFKDGLSTNGKAAAIGSEFDYRPELRAIASKLKMYILVGDSDDSYYPLQKRVVDFIARGNEIEKKENTTPGMPVKVIAGSDFETWINEIVIFNERHLKSHPLYNEIKTTCFHRKNINAFGNMMGHLKALVSDVDFWRETAPKKDVLDIDTRGRKSTMLYDVFISHANADKIEYVDELKRSVDKLRVRVFYDKDTLEWGDKWKDKILEGVGQAEFAIIVISENFFGRDWTEKELHEFLNRQNSSGQKIILPILHRITSSQLKEKYPAVADIQALNSADYSCDEIALLYAGQLIKRLKV